ncbi:MAG: hypothetical protein IPP46_14485 [Bacteroidetes bacterium]|nr:hypothetical protein [Bacteroidota bacterium]
MRARTLDSKPSIGNSDYVERTLATGFELNGEGYIVGGLGVGRQNFRNSLNDVFKYNQAVPGPE